MLTAVFTLLLAAESVRAADRAGVEAAAVLARMTADQDRGGAALELTRQLIRVDGCDRALDLLRRYPQALDAGSDELTQAAITNGRSACLAGLADLLAARSPKPPLPGAPSPAPELHHRAAVLKTLASRADGAASLAQAEAEIAAAPNPELPDLAALPPSADPRLRAMLQALAVRARFEQALTKRTEADEALWRARAEELQLFSDAGPKVAGARALYRATFDRFVVAALTAGAKAPPDVLDELATRLLAEGQEGEAARLMTAATRNETGAAQHSLASRRFDRAIEAHDYTAAAAAIEAIDPATAGGLTDVAVGVLGMESPAALLSHDGSFDRWANGAAWTATQWRASLAEELADAGLVDAARPMLAEAAVAIGRAAGEDDRYDLARATVARTAARLGNGALAWQVVAPLKANHDRYVAAVSALATGALGAGDSGAVERAFATLTPEEQGYVFESALPVLRRTLLATRRALIARALAFAGRAEAFQAKRIRLGLATEMAGQGDLADDLPAVLAGLAPAEREAATIAGAVRSDAAAEAAREEQRVSEYARLAALETRLADAALAGLAGVSSDTDRNALVGVCANLARAGEGKQVADGIGDPAVRVAAYARLIGASRLPAQP